MSNLAITLVSILVTVSLISIPILTNEGNASFKHALEWNYFMGVISFYLLTFFFWKKFPGTEKLFYFKNEFITIHGESHEEYFFKNRGRDKNHRIQSLTDLQFYEEKCKSKIGTYWTEIHRMD